MKSKLTILLVIICSVNASAQQLTAPSLLKAKFGGIVNQRLKANLENWELPAPSANPALIEMFYDRDRQPSRKPLPWSGEFIGKYLCSSILSYRILEDPRQKQQLQDLTKRFIASQAEDGYLGAFDNNEKLTGNNWDIWSHYWAIRALIMYYREFNDADALLAATRAADMLVSKFMNKDFHFTNDGGQGQMNYAVIHAFTQLYSASKNPSYLEMARWIVKEWEQPGAGRYMSMAANGYEMYEFPANRWESLHDFQGMYDMYLITGEEKYRNAFEHIWFSIQKGDRHNTGGFTTGEKTTGDPYADGAIETCCTVAWIDMSVDMLKLTGNSLVADELELSTYNGVLGAQAPSGRWWTYSTPMDGVKKASQHEINFQCRPGSPELNCCSVNGPRALAMIPEWAVLNKKNGVVLNFYGESSFATKTPAGRNLILSQATDYPQSGKILLAVKPNQPERFELLLRIPSWSAKTVVKVNGESLKNVSAGAYYIINREWKKDDKIEITLDMEPHYWVGEKRLRDRVSIYYGPLLLAFDPVYNSVDADKISPIEPASLTFTKEKTAKIFKPLVLFSLNDNSGKRIILCDFITAGAYGNNYITWLPAKGFEGIVYDKQRPVWVNGK